MSGWFLVSDRSIITGAMFIGHMEYRRQSNLHAMRIGHVHCSDRLDFVSPVSSRLIVYESGCRSCTMFGRYLFVRWNHIMHFMSLGHMVRIGCRQLLELSVGPLLSHTECIPSPMREWIL